MSKQTTKQRYPLADRAVTFMYSEYLDLERWASDWSDESRNRLAFCNRNIREHQGVSQTTAHRIIHWMLERKFIELAKVTDWRPNSKKHWYKLTDKGIDKVIHAMSVR